MQNPSLPVYFVVVEPARTSLIQFQILNILKVVEGDIADYNDVYESYVAPLTAQGRNVFYYIFSREVDNPFRERVEEVSLQMKISLGDTATDNPYETLQAYIERQEESTEEEEQAYHDKVWESD